MARFRTAKITPRTVEALKPGETIRDTELDGFFVRCQVGARIYFVRKHAHGQRHFLTIGKHGSEWTPAKARGPKEALRPGRRKGEDQGDAHRGRVGH